MENKLAKCQLENDQLEVNPTHRIPGSLPCEGNGCLCIKTLIIVFWPLDDPQLRFAALFLSFMSLCWLSVDLGDLRKQSKTN